MSKTKQALDWLSNAPPDTTRTQQEASKLFGLSQACISAAIVRERRKTCPVIAERKACAALAESMGAPLVSDAILKRLK